MLKPLDKDGVPGLARRNNSAASETSKAAPTPAASLAGRTKRPASKTPTPAATPISGHQCARNGGQDDQGKNHVFLKCIHNDPFFFNSVNFEIDRNHFETRLSSLDDDTVAGIDNYHFVSPFPATDTERGPIRKTRHGIE